MQSPLELLGPPVSASYFRYSHLPLPVPFLYHQHSCNIVGIDGWHLTLCYVRPTSSNTAHLDKDLQARVLSIYIPHEIVPLQRQHLRAWPRKPYLFAFVLLQGYICMASPAREWRKTSFFRGLHTNTNLHAYLQVYMCKNSIKNWNPKKMQH